MADGVLSLKGTLVGAAGSGGHAIKDNGTAVTQRPTMNLTDFDIADDSINEETDIKPHRLTSAEMSEICSPLPDSPTLVGNVRMSLLWTNPSPSADFAAGDVLLDLSDYDFVFVIASHGASNMMAMGENGRLILALDSGAASRGANVQWRVYYTATDKITFTDCYAQYTGQAATANNGALRPLKIYGIKLV